MSAGQEESRSRGRPVTFDRDELVENVMLMFWERGYANVSLNEIAQESGLTRASLYNSFGSKDALFLLALEHYAENAPDQIIANLDKDESVGDALYAMFEEAVQLRAKDKQRKGCFYTNCINELVGQDIDVKANIKQMAAKQKKLVKALITRAVKRKELPANTDITVTTNMLISFMHGFATFSKTGASKADMAAMCKTFLQQLGFKAPK